MNMVWTVTRGEMDVQLIRENRRIRRYNMLHMNHTAWYRCEDISFLQAICKSTEIYAMQKWSHNLMKVEYVTRNDLELGNK